MPRTYNELNELVRKEKKKNAEQGAKIEILENDVEYLEQSKVDVWTVDDIQNIDPDILNALHCGDVVRKATDNQRHSYVVSYKEDGVGICLTYADASIVETVSYDKSGDTWVYNSKDLTHLPTDYDQQQWSEKSNVEGNPTLAGTETRLDGIEIDGVKYSNPEPTPYSLPTASADNLGGVKVGNGLAINDGVLSATGTNHLYCHAIFLSLTLENNNFCNIRFLMYTPDLEVYNQATFRQKVKQYVSNDGMLPITCPTYEASGLSKDFLYDVQCEDNRYVVRYFKPDGTLTTTYVSSGNFQDKVKQIF